MIEEANARSERAEECWPIADLLRVKGEPLLLQGAPGAAAVAEDHFRQALDWVRRQGALSWERAAASLTRLLQGRSADAVAPPPVGPRPVHRGLRNDRPRSCPKGWCKSGGVFALSGGFRRFDQAATAGSLKIGSSLNGAMISRVM